MPDVPEPDGAGAVSGEPALVAVCPACDRVSWPPSPHCPHCLVDTVRRSLPKSGRILEYSRVGETYFCMAEFGNGIRIMCALRGTSTEPVVGQSILLDRVERKGADYSFGAHVAESS